MALMAERLREVMSYDPDTGIFTWKVRTTNRVQVGDQAGHPDPQHGYRLIGIDGRIYHAARLAFLYMTGAMPSFVDHKDRVRLNDRWANLRPATRSQNQANRSRQLNNTSGFKGVTPHQGKWMARVTYKGRTRRVSGFDTAVAAAAAYDEIARRMHGSFAHPNGG